MMNTTMTNTTTIEPSIPAILPLTRRQMCAATLGALAASVLPVSATPSMQKRITFAFFADIHGQLEEHPEMYWASGKDEIVPAGGVARIAKLMREIRAENPEGTITLDLGDTIQGSGHVVMSEGATMIDPINALQIDYWLPGNWEVIYGREILLETSRKLRAPAIVANMRDQQTKERLFQPYVIRETAGLKIALIGFTDPDVPLRQPPSFSAGIFYEESDILQPLVDEARKVGQADLIVLMTHIGLPKAVALAETLTGVDVILSADTHERTEQAIVRGQTWVVEAGAFGSHLGKLELFIENGRIVRRDWRLIELRASRYGEDAEVKALVEKTLAPYRENLNRIIGRTDTPLFRYAPVETTADAVLADALLAAGATEIALSNGFRFAYPIPVGDITENDLWNYYPINSRLKTGKVTGAQLRKFFERELENVFSKNTKRLFGGWVPRPAGLTLHFYANKPEGQRIAEMQVNGHPVESERVYTITSCEREGDAESTLCRMRDVADPRLLEVDAHAAVRRYLQTHSPISMGQPRRVIPLDIPPAVRSQFIT
jgi:2',3'-cyclic-nucleotide 2'-phosphodiesterase (5'-nucleotidase family)